MRVIDKTLYTFDELSDTAKERARDWYRSCGDTWGWSDEWWGSAKAFSDIAPITIIRADYDRGDVSYHWTGDEDARELSGLRAWKWLTNNGWFEWAREEAKGRCSMTGYCGDAPFGDAFEQYERNPLKVPDIEQVFYEAAQEWVHAARRDLEYSYSDEAVDESITINEYEFDEEGNRA